MPKMERLPVPPRWSAPLKKFETYLRMAGRADTTIKTRIDRLRNFARYVGGSPMTTRTGTVERYAAEHEWRPETRRSIYSTLKGFYGWLVDVGYRSDNPASVLPVVKAAPPAPKPAPTATIKVAMGCADERTKLIIMLAAFAGLRRGEIAQVSETDLVEDLTGYSLIVHGKGNKQRVVPVSDSLAAAIRVAGKGSWCFPGRKDGHLSAKYVGKLAKSALPYGVHLHMLRHRFASAAYAGTSDLLSVQQLLGHSSPATTQRYIAVPNVRLRRVVEAAAA